jgi:hypothetical protein
MQGISNQDIRNNNPPVADQLVSCFPDTHLVTTWFPTLKKAGFLMAAEAQILANRLNTLKSTGHAHC